MRLTGLKILVTGGRGYVGSHTAKSLVAAGAEVFIVDNRYVSQNKVKGTTLCGMGNYDDPAILDNLQKKGIDGVVHCAGTSLVGPSVLDPSEYYNNNVIRTIRMLDHMSKWDKKPFVVFSSSAAVYGDPLETPIIEQTALLPVNPYGNTKMMIERILHDYDVAYGIKSYCFRYFNAAGADVWGSELGPEPGDTHLIPRIFEAYDADKPFELYGTDFNTPDGTCVRDYIHVCDLAHAHLVAVGDLAYDGMESRTYNLGTGAGYSNLQVLNAFRDIGGKIDVSLKPRREGDPDTLVANADQFTTDTGWNLEFSHLETIIKSYRDYYEKRTK
jgi:UDP-glucose 4-epimerase